MTKGEILKECEAALTQGSGFVSLVLPKGTSARIKGFPRGELLCENRDGGRVYRYDAKKILDAFGLKVLSIRNYAASPRIPEDGK
jgi:hypothetical protein